MKPIRYWIVGALLLGGFLYVKPIQAQPQSPTSSTESALQNSQSQTVKTEPSNRQGRRRLAVVDFRVPDEIAANFNVETSERLSRVLSDMLITELVKTGAFDVIERTELEHLIREQQLNQQGLLDPSTVPQAGKVLGVDLILGGKLTEFGVKTNRGGVLGVLTKAGFGVGIDVKRSTARAVVEARMIDVKTGRVLMAEKGTGENKEQGLLFAGSDLSSFLAAIRFDSSEWNQSRLGKATRQAVEQLVQKILIVFPVEATVLGTLPSGGIILDVGRFQGIKEGDRFEIVRENELRDEKTGELLYRERETLSILKVVEVQEERCKCVREKIVTPGTVPQKGDLAILQMGKGKKK